VRNTLVAAVAFAALLATPAMADLPVVDPASLVAQAKALEQQVKTFVLDNQEYVTQLKQWATQAQQYTMQGQQYLTEATQLAALVQHPNLGAALQAMQITGLSNQLPINPSALMSITSGAGMSLSSLSFAGLSGRLGQLSSFASGAFANNNVYTCTDQSWTCQQQQQRAIGIAGTAGIAQAAYQSLRDHQATIQALEDQAVNADTPAARENIANALQVEQTWTQNLQAQVTAAEMQAQSDTASEVQKQHEATTRDLQQTIADLTGR